MESLTIYKAMKNISTNLYLLPAIQRKFVWSSRQIEMLFDSLMRGYPINTMMLWQISDANLKNNYKFYSFIKDYAQHFKEDNPDASTQFMDNDYYAVIDGQQRLTSLYIGLNGTYREKIPYLWWRLDEEAMPTKRLYIELSSELDQTVDNDKQYNFCFMSEKDIEKDRQKNPEHSWFKVGDIIKFEKNGDVLKYINDNGLANNACAVDILSELYNKINVENVLNFYVIEDQDQDKVLDIFIRTNSGGTPLSFSDLLMSIASANWTQYDVRNEMREVKDIIFGYGSPNFIVSQDFVLKAILVLSDVDVAFKIRNFGRDNILVFEQKWPDIKKSLLATFKFLDHIGYNDTLLRAKNAAIVIAYYIYKKNLADEIVKETYDKEEKRVISKWLAMSLLKGIFGGHPDSVLSSMREIIKESQSQRFPFNEIVNYYKDDVNKNYSFTDDVINSFLEEQFGSTNCGLVLSLLYQDVVLRHGTQIAQDHIHPRITFVDKSRLNQLELDSESREFYCNKINYNSALNLQLLESRSNMSKSDTPLKDWALKEGITNKELFLDDGISLDISGFKEFIECRRKNLNNKLKEILSI